MDHLAILDAKRKLLEKILRKEKTIESRWYVHKKAPYQQIKEGEVIYFKETGNPVTAKARVSKVLFFDKLSLKKVQEILKKYGKKIGFNKITKKNAFEKYKNKKYCTLIFLSNIEKIKSFTINKKGYGLMCAWITVKNIDRIRRIDKK
ncbi:MAG: hypothetical protein AABX82_08275 [Nanoarchaeota archaeon]